mgnify:CR=1 FL=1
MSNYQKWTPEEAALLKDRAASSTVQELAEELGRPVKMVRWKVKKLGLTTKDGRSKGGGVPRTVWTAERLAYLRDNASTLPVAEMADYLGVSSKQVASALAHYRIPGRGRGRKHTPDEIERRVASLRGAVKVDPDEPRECARCGKVVVPHKYPSESGVSSRLCPACRKTDLAERRYGLEPGGLQALLEAQGGLCALCSTDLTQTKMHVDHDHSCCTGRRKACGKCVRGLLCVACNLLEGQMVAYLERGGSVERLLAYSHR